MTERPAPGPQRTCVGCRRLGERSVLLRFVVVRDGGAPAVVLDERRRMPGRGAWLHPDRECLELARRRSAFARALRTGWPVDLAAITAGVERLTGARQEEFDRNDEHDQQAPAPERGRGHRTTPSPSAGPRSTEAGQNADEHPMSTQR